MPGGGISEENMAEVRIVVTINNISIVIVVTTNNISIVIVATMDVIIIVIIVITMVLVGAYQRRTSTITFCEWVLSPHIQLGRCHYHHRCHRYRHQPPRPPPIKVLVDREPSKKRPKEHSRE